MGAVYRAKDTMLGREVAIKVLHSAFSIDQDRLHRFEQEARAASALNHPNIITIHEFGQEGGVHFIVSELIEGETLRRRMAKGRMDPGAVLDVAIQAASALNAAHEAGIVHRDIKPENIMRRTDGYVKVLDFGLAKLTELRMADFGLNEEAETLVQPPQDNPQSAIRNPQLTDPGAVMGTVSYMSPEQARGLEVDARTDIFSLGIVLYEMAAGRAPFAGATKSDVLVSILDKEPVSLTRHSPEVPAELQRIVSKALAKDREERYQTVKDLLIDLRRLKQDVEFEARLERTGSPDVQGFRVPPSGGLVTDAKTPPEGGTPNVSSAEVIINEIKRHKRAVALTLAGIVLVIAGIAFGLYKWIGQRQPTAPFQAAKLTAVTTNGKAVAAAISPDGKYVAYAMDEDRKQSLWLRQVATGSSGPIVPAAEVLYSGLTFSRDGNFLYYVARDQNNMALTSLHQTTLFGHNPRKLIEGIRATITFSPDGNRFAFMRRNELIVANADGSNEQTLATRQQPDSFTGPVAWSPDGKILACVAWRADNDPYNTLVAVSVEGGAEKPMTARRWDTISSVAWLADGSGVVISALDTALAPNAQLWQLSYPGGEEIKITNDLNDYRGVSLTADSTTLVTLQESLSLSLSTVTKGESSRATEITARTGKTDGQWGVAWTPDGKIIYTSNASGSLDFWAMNADGSNKKQLTMNAGLNFSPAVSPDGRYLVFGSDRAGARGIWRMNLDGSSPKQLANEGSRPQCSPDGKWVVYHGSRPPTLWKVPMEGGAPAQLTTELSHYAAISPDGKRIAYFSGGPTANIAVIPSEGGPPMKTFDSPRGSLLPGLRWTPDGQALTYVRGDNIWSQPFDGGPPTQLTDFKTERIYAFDWSRDGRLLVSRGVTNRDVVLIGGFK
jgi:serine/threonine protein kinase/Tol biopolymer transport system component